MAEFVGNYIKQSDVEDRLSAAVVRRIYDDPNIGAVSNTDGNDGPIVRLIKDAESKFEGYCRGIYPLDALRTAKPNEAIRLVLDCAEALAAKRFPRAFARDWQPLMTNVESELKSLRRAETRFDVVGSPEPPANVGGTITSGDFNNEDAIADPVFLNGFGVF